MHDQGRRQGHGLGDELFDATDFIGDLSGLDFVAAGDLQRLAADINVDKNRTVNVFYFHPWLFELQVLTTVRVAQKDGPARAPSAQLRASSIPEAARATRAVPRIKTG